jgi:V-type H+-transporting ATPase subunit a
MAAGQDVCWQLTFYHVCSLVTPQGGDKMARVGFVAGTIQSDKIAAFERLLFRATRGNVFLKQSAVGKIRDPASGEEMEKSVFVIFFAGERSRAKVNKVGRCTLHSVPGMPRHHLLT